VNQEGRMLLEKSLIENTISYALEKGADFAEIFVEKKFSQSIKFLDKQVDGISSDLDYGLGLRLFLGEEILYATTSRPTENSLRDLVDQLIYRKTNSNLKPQSFLAQPESNSLISLNIKPWDQSLKEKINYLSDLDSFGRSVSDKVSQLQLSMNQQVQEVLIANSEGVFVEDVRPYSQVIINAVATDGGAKSQGLERKGFMMGSELFKNLDAKQMTKDAVEQAIRLLSAKNAPAGKLPVILNNGFGGVIFHEACGHGLETTSVATGASVFSGKMGEKIAHEEVTAIDNGQMQYEWGSLEFDDEGMRTQNTTLIENGVLKNYIVDKMGAIKTGYPRSGSGRRQSYHYAPASRMRNTYIAPGPHELEDMIKDVDYGLFAQKLGGGSVDTGTGAYNFAVTEGRIIRKGQLEETVKGASLIGTGFDTLSKITKVGKDLKLSPGTCGSVSGWVPVTVGQPPLLVSEITVGGAAND